MGLQSDNSLFAAQKSQSFKTAKLTERSPGNEEKFFVRYIGKDENGNKVVGNVSPALVFTNVGIEKSNTI